MPFCQHGPFKRGYTKRESGLGDWSKQRKKQLRCVPNPSLLSSTIANGENIGFCLFPLHYQRRARIYSELSLITRSSTALFTPYALFWYPALVMVDSDDLCLRICQAWVVCLRDLSLFHSSAWRPERMARLQGENCENCAEKCEKRFLFRAKKMPTLQFPVKIFFPLSLDILSWVQLNKSGDDISV